MACGTTPNHPAVLGDCSKQPCIVPPTGGGTTGVRDAGIETSTGSDAAMDTGTDTGTDTGVDTGTDSGMLEAGMGDSP